ncbi:hydroxyacid dehydrogenase [bacterium]|nr:hydroxyacid dehydrogenase [bacterium]
MGTKIHFLVQPHLIPQIFSEEVLAEFRKLGEVKIWDGQAAKEFFLSGANIVITSWGTPKLEGNVLEIAPNLRFIFHAAGTVKPYVQPELLEKGVKVSSGSNIIARYVALTALGYILLAVKKIFWWNEHIKNELGWRDDEKLWSYTCELCDVSIGIISMSSVGRNLINLLLPLTNKIQVYDPYWSEDAIKSFGAKKVDDLVELAKNNEIIVLCAPLTEETRGMLGREFFESMKDGGVFINPARGGIVDEEALIKELEKERIFACIDVTDPDEPPSKDNRLRFLKNVVLSPHIAGCVRGGLKDIGRFALDEINRFLQGKPLLNEIDLTRWGILA